MGLFGKSIVKCSFCGKESDRNLKLADGAISDECATVRGEGWKQHIFLLDHRKPSKKITCNEVRMTLAEWEDKKRILAALNITRVSPSGKILVDDYQRVICVKKNGRPVLVPHRISDLRDFYLEYDYEEKGVHSKDGSYFSVESGFITINLNKPVNDCEEIHVPVDKKMFAQRNEVKKVYEPDLLFLEQVTGMKRRPIPNKIKIF